MKESLSGVVLNTVSKGASPESKCPICLDHFKNISYLDVCLHKFCFCCIHEWSKNKAECPLCKQPFNSIYHTIKSEDNYKRFDLRPTENGSFGNMAGQRFRYRTTLTGDRRPAPRRTSPPPDHGVIFEGLRGSLPQRHNRDLHSMIRRLAVRQGREREGRSVQSLHEQEMVKFRRALYRRGVRVQSVQDGGRSRQTSAEFFKRNPACLHRLVPWLRRELTVLYGTHGSLVNIVQHIIMTLITRHNLDDQTVVHEIRPFLLSHTEHFLHEFLSFAQSPFNMEAYDQRAVYDLPRPSGEGSSSETSVIAISEDESDSLVSGSQDYATPSLTLSQTAWDDETPGPSYSLEPSQVLPFPVRESDSDSSVGEAVVSVASVPNQDHPANTGTIAVEEEHSAGSDNDCVIIGYVKSVSERTPELVQLSSDSEHSEQNAELQIPRAPQHILFISESDLSSTDTRSPSRRPTRCSHSPEKPSSHPRKKDKYAKGHHERELLGSREGSSRSNMTHSSSRSRKHPLSKESKQKQRREKRQVTTPHLIGIHIAITVKEIAAGDVIQRHAHPTPAITEVYMIALVLDRIVEGEGGTVRTELSPARPTIRTEVTQEADLESSLTPPAVRTEVAQGAILESTPAPHIRHHGMMNMAGKRNTKQSIMRNPLANCLLILLKMMQKRNTRSITKSSRGKAGVQAEMTNLRVTVGNITRRRRNTRGRVRGIIVRRGWEKTALFSLHLLVTVTVLTPVNPQPVISVQLTSLSQ